MLIDLLRLAMTDLESLVPDEPEELAGFIKALRAAHAPLPATGESLTMWQDPAGAWSDLPEHDEAECFFRLRRDLSLACLSSGHEE